MLKLAGSLISKNSIHQAFGESIRPFSRSAIINAKAASKSKDGKKKAKQGFKKKADPKATKAKKGGMTHLGFKDAVRSLNFERLATDFENLNIKELSHKDLDSISSSVVKYAESTEKALTVLDSFKKYQQHELFKRPISMVSRNTLKLNEIFIEKLSSSSKDNRLCLLGEKGSGKSTLITQAKALALSKFNGDAIILHIDHPEKITEGSSDYIFNKRAEIYQQPMFTKRWIKKLRAANEDIFKKLPLTRDISFVAKKTEYNLKKGENTLYDMVLYNHDFGKAGPSTAFQFFIEELEHHSKEFPVLIAIDDFNSLTCNYFTEYRHPDFKRIHVNEFEVGKFILEAVSGELNFEKGGILLAESKDIAEGLTLPIGLGLKEFDPYYKSDQCDFSIASKMLSNGGVKSLVVENLTKEESRELLEFWDATGILQIREYPSNDIYKTSQQLSEELNTKRSGEFVEEFTYDPEEQFEKIVQNHYTASSGNPGYLLRATTLLY